MNILIFSYSTAQHKRQEKKKRKERKEKKEKRFFYLSFWETNFS